MRPMKRTIAATLVAISTAFSYGLNASELNFTANGTGSIYRVIDGDTIIATGISSPAFETLAKYVAPKYVNHKYRSVRIRIDGINTAESGTVRGEAATQFLVARAEKANVQFRCYDVGDFGRALCNVMFGPNNTDIGSLMIRNGYSRYFTKYGGVPFEKLGRHYRSLSDAQ